MSLQSSGISGPDDGRWELFSDLTRRQLLRVLGNVGVGASFAELVTPGDFLVGDRGRTTIVYGYARSDPDNPWSLEPRTKTVPTPWYNDVKRAVRVQKLLQSWGGSKMLGSFVVPGGYDGATSLSVDVLDGGLARLPTRLAKLIRRINFDINEIDDPTLYKHPDIEPTVDSYAGDVENGRIPGGVGCTSPQYTGTLAPAMFDREQRQQFFTTANHLYGKGGNEAHRAPRRAVEPPPPERPNRNWPRAARIPV